MAIHIELRPELEHRLAEQARAQGVTISSYLEFLLDRSLTGAEGNQAFLPPEDWSRELRRWGKEFPRQRPLLSDEATSRENLYDDD
jgi:hypothetical protein